jgi:hypothetical protein
MSCQHPNKRNTIRFCILMVSIVFQVQK